MLKLLIKLAIAGLLANAVFHVGSEYLTYIKFRDSVRDAAMFKASDDEELSRRIMQLASEYEIPLDETAISINRENRTVSVRGNYEKPIEVAPSLVYRWPFSWSIDVVTSTVVPAPTRGR